MFLVVFPTIRAGHLNFPELDGKKHHFLVTGGAGFIGSNLSIELVRLGQKVTVLDNFATGKKENVAAIEAEVGRAGKGANFSLIDGDIRDAGACAGATEGVDYILHNAALGSVPRSISDPVTSTEVNVMGTLNMLVAAKEAGVRRFVYASSSSVYGDSAVLPKVEGGEGVPLSPYAVTKVADELMAENFQRVYGLEVVGLRYFNIFGPRQDPSSRYAAVIPIFIEKLLKGESPLINGDGETSRDFTYVGNAVAANIGAALAPPEASGRAYNIACGGRISLNELFAVIKELTGVRLDAEYGPERAGDVRHSNADISLAKKYLGYEPKVDSARGLELTVKWYMEKLAA